MVIAIIILSIVVIIQSIILYATARSVEFLVDDYDRRIDRMLKTIHSEWQLDITRLNRLRTDNKVAFMVHGLNQRNLNYWDTVRRQERDRTHEVVELKEKKQKED